MSNKSNRICEVPKNNEQEKGRRNNGEGTVVRRYERLGKTKWELQSTGVMGVRVSGAYKSKDAEERNNLDLALVFEKSQGLTIDLLRGNGRAQ